MRVARLSILIVLALAVPSRADAPFPVIGTKAPDFTLTSQQEHPVRLSQFRG